VCVLLSAQGEPVIGHTAVHADVVIVGAGAAGLLTAIVAARGEPALTVICLDGARRIGAKILVSGGSRCNVTNRSVDERDFWSGSRRHVTRVLRAFSATRTREFFTALGVSLHEEEDGKLFPDTNRSRTVLDALLQAAADCHVAIRSDTRVDEIARMDSGFVVRSGSTAWRARRVVLATGGRSLPKTGSDGFGYALAARLGHGYVETTPALAPLVLEGNHHQELSGISHAAALTCGTGDGRVRREGALLWTHFGISGPVALDISRHWHRALLEQRPSRVVLDVCPHRSVSALDDWLLEQRDARPKAFVATVVSSLVPAAVAEQWCRTAGVGKETTMTHMTRDERRALVQALKETTLNIRDSRGYGYAEVTAGGIPLDEVDAASMESRVCPGLHLVGEILDVDGRLGGFNFQWAWSSGWVAGQALALALRPETGR
jgi:predicted Rossmann fold flavoprotein